MWMKLIAALLALINPSLRERENSAPDFGIVPGIGPQTLEELEQAHSALHGPHEGGDILVDEGKPSGDGIKAINFRWYGYPGQGVVPYEIDPSLDFLKDMIKDAMEQYKSKTCVEFVPKHGNHRDWIYLTKGTGCNSYVGRQGGRQIVNLGDGCHYLGTVIHELGHAIGFHHEHQRSDRDNYLYVYKQNIVPDFVFAFDKTNKTDEIILTPYDYDSIMHYGNYAFSRNANAGLYTMLAKNGQQLLEPYNKPGFTNTDVTAIKKLYKCR